MSNDKITELLEIDKISPQGWWIYWEFMPVNSINCPNFKIFNDAYFDLYDDYKFEKFIDSCEKSIFDMLNKLKDKKNHHHHHHHYHNNNQNLNIYMPNQDKNPKRHKHLQHRRLIYFGGRWRWGL